MAVIQEVTKMVNMLKTTFYRGAGVFLLFIFLLGAEATASSATNEFFSKADAFLKQYVKNGGVDYKTISGHPTEIEHLYKMIGEESLIKMEANEKKAFYINAYNLIVIYWVVKHYPLRSPLDDSGFFDKIKHKVAGEEMTLNSLEIKKLLLPFKDGRIHFTLACAAKSCPPLASFAFMPTTLEQQLTERTTTALNNPDWIKVNRATSTVALSKIFEWYKNDFMQNGKTQVEWINQFRREMIPNTFSVSYYEYNWSLNEL